MKKRALMPVITILILAAMLFSGCAGGSGFDRSTPRNVLCLGDSITQGLGIKDVKNKAYPAQLADLLGADYQVFNFGVAGTTVCPGSEAYTDTKTYKNVVETKADVIVLQLGTNDAHEATFDAEAFDAAYRTLVGDLKKAARHAEIILVLPSPIYMKRFNYSDAILKDELIPIIQDIADEYGLKTVDAYTAFEGREDLLKDGLHPNENGAAVLAELVARAIVTEDR